MVPAGVFLWTGSGGGGPDTDLFVEDVAEVYSDAGIPVGSGETLPDDFAEVYGTLMYMNPMDEFDSDVNAAASTLLDAGGRIVLIMEHCKNGCWGNPDENNALLASLGSTMELPGDGGSAFENVDLLVSNQPPLSDGVETMTAFYTGSVVVNDGQPIGTIPEGDTVIAHERIGECGDVVAVADSSIFGYVLSGGDNVQFVANLADHSSP
jgi:hypothetical protein